MRNQRYLILGSNSNAGSHFVNYCVEKGFDIIQTSRSEMNEGKFLANNAVKKVPFYIALTRDLECVDYCDSVCEYYSYGTKIKISSD